MSTNRIFISYSHRGDGPAWKDVLLRELRVFEDVNLLDVWQDGEIRISSYWDDDIKKAIAEAQLAVILLTKEALESKYILETELPLLKQRRLDEKLAVFPVICEPCSWESHEWLQATQSTNKSRPLSELNPEQQQRTFRHLATSIAETLSQISNEMITASIDSSSDTNVFLDQFPITSSSPLLDEKLIGREQELALLDLAFQQSTTAIVSLVAWGGVGKSMLVKHWLQKLDHLNWQGIQKVYAWNFFSQGTTEDRQGSDDLFLAHALEWFGVSCDPAVSAWEKGRLLAEAIQQTPTVLLLDGIEPLQYPPGPMGGQLRAAGVQSLLKHIARYVSRNEFRGLCLVTTREPLTDLVDFQRRAGSPWGSLLRIDLGNLTDEAGAFLLHHVGANRAGVANIKPDDKELIAASKEVDGHALTLNLLGRFIARAHGGDIRRRDLVKFDVADKSVQGGTTFKMLAAFEEWFSRGGEFGARQLAVLRLLGLFDRPADSGCLGALRELPVIEGLTEPIFTMRTDKKSGEITLHPIVDEDWNTVISFLGDFGLVTVQSSAPDDKSLIDCHAVIRDYFSSKLNNQQLDVYILAQTRLYEHLRDLVEAKPNTLEDLQPLYDAMRHGCRAGLYRKSRDEVWRDRIQRGNDYFSINQLGAISNELAIATLYFKIPFSSMVNNLIIPEMTLISNTAGFCLHRLGRLTEAKEAYTTSLNVAHFITQHGGSEREEAIRSGNLALLESTLGNVNEALTLARDADRLADELGDPFQRLEKRTLLGYIYTQMGDMNKSVECFEWAHIIQRELHPEMSILYSIQGFRYNDMFFCCIEFLIWRYHMQHNSQINFSLNNESDDKYHLETVCHEIFERATLEASINTISEWTLDLALCELTKAKASLYSLIVQLDIDNQDCDSQKLHDANEQLSCALQYVRIAGDQEFLALALLSMAWSHFLVSDYFAAQSDLDEAWDIAARGPMRLHMADIHLYRARLFFRENEYPWESPEHDLAEAERLINECGYHRRDIELADAKLAILGK